MSDRIRYPVGNTAGRDLINWPSILRSEIATVIGALSADDIDAGWPVELSIEQIMALVWRVKKWRFSGSATVGISYFDAGIDQTTIATGTANIDDTDFFPTLFGAAITRERDLLANVFSPTYQALVNDGINPLAQIVSDWDVSGTDEIGGGGASPFSESDSSTGGLIGILGGFTLFDDPKISPPFNGQIELFRTSVRLSATVGFDKNPSSAPFGNPITLRAPGNMTIDFGAIADSVDVPMQLSWRLTGEANDSLVSGAGTADFLLEAVEFFPYENSENLPVWDSATGAQLLDPFS